MHLAAAVSQSVIALTLACAAWLLIRLCCRWPARPQALASAGAGETGAAAVAVVAAALVGVAVTGLSALSGPSAAVVLAAAPLALALPSTWRTPAPSPAWDEQQQQGAAVGCSRRCSSSPALGAAPWQLQQALQLVAGVVTG
jgi:hypothetical protein